MEPFIQYFISFLIYFAYWLHWVFIAACRLSLVASEWGLLSRCGVGLSWWWLPLLLSADSGVWASVVGPRGLNSVALAQ